MRAWPAALLALLACPTAVRAGAWAAPQGETLVIAEYDTIRSDEAFDANGTPVAMAFERSDDFASIYIEHGLTERLTVQFKAEGQRAVDGFGEFAGSGQTEIGLRWQAYRDDRTAVSLYAAYALAGDGRYAGFAAPGAGRGDWEARMLVGRSGRLAVRGRETPLFAEAQLARRIRDGLADETRLEMTLGAELTPRWSVMARSYAGRIDEDQASWVSGELSVVRQLGRWSAQAGWRRVLAGRDVPVQQGLVLAVWRRF